MTVYMKLTELSESQKENIVVKLIGQLYEIRTRRDGGSRIVIDVGNDSIQGIMELQKLNGSGELNLAIALTPFQDF